jgi:hypothetical protein
MRREPIFSILINFNPLKVLLDFCLMPYWHSGNYDPWNDRNKRKNSKEKDEIREVYEEDTVV